MDLHTTGTSYEKIWHKNEKLYNFHKCLKGSENLKMC